MDWLRENWFSGLAFILFIAIHLFGYGMHGGHGGHEIRRKAYWKRFHLNVEKMFCE